MSLPDISQVAWTPRRWTVSVLLVWAAHLALVFSVSDKPRRLPHPASDPPRVRVTVPGAPMRAAPAHADPTLFALVTRQGFSRSAWLTIPRFQYRLTNQTEPFFWLTLPAEDFADEFSEFVQTNLLSEELVPHDVTPALAYPRIPKPVVVPLPVVQVEGKLAARPWVSPPVLPHQDQTILTNTVVSVLVDAEGTTLSAALLSRSGVAQVDRDALQFARGARFAPLTRAEPSGGTNADALMVGRLVFQWSRIRWNEPAAITAQK